MRLTTRQIARIKEQTESIFGKNARVFLFGSRIDDSKKGGDIDLYIIPENRENSLDNKIKLLAKLETILGEQKIDLIIAANNDKPIEREAITKGIELNLETIKRQKIINECDRHLQRINEAYGDMAQFMPINAVKYENLSKNQIQAIDQYLFRFSKLQDAMGEKLFKLLLAQYEENSDKLPFLDVLNRLEKYLDMELTNEWLDLRKIRNQLAHEYEDDAIDMANMINLIHAKKDVIERIYLAVKSNCFV